MACVSSWKQWCLASDLTSDSSEDTHETVLQTESVERLAEECIHLPTDEDNSSGQKLFLNMLESTIKTWICDHVTRWVNVNLVTVK